MAEPANSERNGAASESPVHATEDGQSRTQKALRPAPTYDQPSGGRAPLFRR